MANTTELSPIWHSLLYELKQQILDHHTDNVIASCTPPHDLYDSAYVDFSYTELERFDPDFTGRVYRHWLTFRQDSLFESQRKRMEQHFLDIWLPKLSIYLELDLSRWDIGRSACARYLPISDFTVQDTNDILQDTDTSTFSADPDSEKVSFYLHMPVSAQEPTPDHEIASELHEIHMYNEPEYYSALPTLVSQAWQHVVDNGGRGDTAVSFGVGLRMPGDEFQHWRASDIFRSWTVGIDVAGLDVLDQGRRIQFKWKPMMAAFLEHMSTVITVWPLNPEYHVQLFGDDE